MRFAPGVYIIQNHNANAKYPVNVDNNIRYIFSYTMTTIFVRDYLSINSSHLAGNALKVDKVGQYYEDVIGNATTIPGQ
jgi:hypothetical protein